MIYFRRKLNNFQLLDCEHETHKRSLQPLRHFANESNFPFQAISLQEFSIRHGRLTVNFQLVFSIDWFLLRLHIHRPIAYSKEGNNSIYERNTKVSFGFMQLRELDCCILKAFADKNLRCEINFINILLSDSAQTFMAQLQSIIGAFLNAGNSNFVLCCI